MRQSATNRLTILTTSILLLTPLNVAVSGRIIEWEIPIRQSDVARKAEDLFKEALTMVGTSDQRLVRDRISIAMRLWIELREPEKAARSSIQIAECYRRAKRFTECLFYCNLALEVRPLSAQTKAAAFNATAKVYTELYHRDLAVSYYRKALTEAVAAKDVTAQTDILIGLASLYYRSGEKDRALAYIAQLRRLVPKQLGPEAEGAIQYLSGLINQDQGLVNEARQALEEALAIYQRTGNTEEQVKVLCSISALLLSSGQNQAALEQARQAYDEADIKSKAAANDSAKLKVREIRWRVSLALARAQRAMGQKDLAVKSYFRALNNIEAIWWSVTRATSVGAVAFGEERQAPYRELVDLLIELGQLNEAYQVIEQARSRAILGLIEARRAIGARRLADRDATLGELARSIAGLRTRLLSSQLSQTERSKLEKEIESAELAYDEAYATLEMKHSKERLAWFRPAALDQVQKKISPDQECVLQFFLGQERSFVWLISSSDFSLEVLPGRKDLEESVQQYITLIRTKPNNLYLERDLARQRNLGENLSARLFGRLADRLAATRRLIIAPDGILYYLPFEALIRKGRYLVEDHEISYILSASMLTQTQGPYGGAEAGDKIDLLAFGDPIFGPKGYKGKSGNNANDRTGQVLRASDGFKLASLPRTRDEVEEIASLFGPGRSRVYLGKGSSEDAVKAESLRRCKRLHFATHSFIDERNPSRSAIVLTLDGDPQEDGFLEVGEVAELDLDCDLVVLSACQTGRGLLLSGEGIVGLTRAFLYAGARSVVVSLWSVSDISTSQLMKGFYQHLLSGLTNAAALREAKLQMIRSVTETRHPYYWAPFIVVGKP